jgi:hypothetical protein
LAMVLWNSKPGIKNAHACMGIRSIKQVWINCLCLYWVAIDLLCLLAQDVTFPHLK